MDTNNLFNIIKILLSNLSLRRRTQLGFLLFLTILSSIAEVLSLAAVIPFLGILTQPDIFIQNSYIQPLLQKFGYNDPTQIMYFITAVFIIAALIAGTVRLTLLYLQTRIAFGIGTDLAVEAYRKTLHQPYETHIHRNSSEVINVIINQTDVVVKSIIMPALVLASSLIIMTAVITVLLTINPWLTFAAFFFFGVTYGCIVKLSRKHLHHNSEILALNSNTMIKNLQEGIGGIREMLLRSNQDLYIEKYHSSDIAFRRAAGNNIFIANSPRSAIEAIGISFIAILALITIQRSAADIAVLGALALGCQRLLPILQQSYSSYSSILGSTVSFYKLASLLDQKYPNIDRKQSDLVFNKSIELRNISFRYHDYSPWVLKDINITIPKGCAVGIIGKTGSGKSTLVDIIMGLLTPTTGEILIDGIPLKPADIQNWRRLMSHVPQAIFVTDASFADNIVFGQNDELEIEMIEKAAKKACLHDKIKNMPQGYRTMVGEGGVSLSGGEKQRLGIARALYNNSSILVLDEATSALDSDTESAVMAVINNRSLNVTKLIIAHRTTTLSECDVVYDLGSGGNSITTLKYIDLI